MSRYIYNSRSSSGTSLAGCGCLLLIGLVLIFIFRALWALLPFILLVFLGLAFYRLLFEDEAAKKERVEEQFYNPDREKDGQVVRPKKGSIKQAEIIDDDDR